MGRRLRRALRFAVMVTAAMVLPGALLVAAVAYGAYGAISRADPSWKPTLAVLVWARIWTLVYRVPFSMALAILHNEGASTPRTLRAAELDALNLDNGSAAALFYPPGDIGDLRGPSVGPGQVLRENVERLWRGADAAFFRVRAPGGVAQLARVGEERRALWASVKMMREALAEKGDVHDAIARYNGFGAAAEKYAQRAGDFLDALELGG